MQSADASPIGLTTRGGIIGEAVYLLSCVAPATFYATTRGYERVD